MNLFIVEIKLSAMRCYSTKCVVESNAKHTPRTKRWSTAKFAGVGGNKMRRLRIGEVSKVRSAGRKTLPHFLGPYLVGPRLLDLRLLSLRLLSLRLFVKRPKIYWLCD